MTNQKKLVMALGCLVPKGVSAELISEDALKMIACPFEAVEDPEALEIEGCPSAGQCAACKRAWLGREAI